MNEIIVKQITIVPEVRNIVKYMEKVKKQEKNAALG
jgi:ribosomal protein S30